MVNHSLTKSQKREIRRLAGLAHERELARALEVLHAEFTRWRNGEIDVFTLNEQIHKFHDGISRDLFKAYCMGNEDLSVGSALGRNVLQESEVNPQVLPALKGSIEFFRKIFAEQKTKE